MNKFFALAPLQAAQALLGFGTIAAFTRLLSPEEFGRYALVLSISMFAHTLVFTWAEAAAFRFFSTAKAERRLADHFATLMALALCLGAGALIVTAALLKLCNLHEDVAAVSAFAAGAAVFRFLVRTVRETERASLQTMRFAMAETAYLGLGFAAGLALLLKFDLGAVAPFAGLMLAGTIMFLIDGPKLFERARGGRISLDRIGAYAGYGAPLAAALATDLGVQSACRFILAHQSGEAALGAYAAAFGLARIVDLVFLCAGAALSPLLFSAFESEGAAGAKKQAGAMFNILVAAAPPVAVGLALISAPLAQMLIGPALSAEAAAITPFLALAGMMAGFNLYYLSEAFQLTRRTALRAVLMLAPGAAQIVLTLVLVPLHGAVGAAFAALAAAGVGALVLFGFGRTLIGLPIFSTHVARALIALAAMSLGVVLVQAADPLAALALKVSVGAAIYLGCALAFDLCGARRALAQAARFILEKTHASAAS